ncbi:sulfatase-like hydrolase/transferase [Pseudomonas sp. Gutcm_11s]|uniref:sulfatase-like hydrolase/transferase n=1 Tax=Pseudomonas sp. Gutcm_11s TaxID=3026088 RepID=UPI00235F5BE9|nr:sulfatase-like hydrolase/transferase [Pseudomonas sp. Gutcm_11s]MDD0842119.1 sulfatase-like hydrolase/transferase [Pseudomonas sp. Gutcm_11s]
MQRRELLKKAAALSAAGLAAPVLGQQTAPALVRPAGRKPNILLIVTDQQRAHQDLPSAVPLPGHERLLQRAASLGNFHVNTTPCSPSRSVLFTGQHTQKTLITANVGLPPFRELSPQIPTLGHMLREQGYLTAYKGKWHLSHIEQSSNLTYGVVQPSTDALLPYGFADYNLNGDPHGSLMTGFIYDKVTASDSVAWLQQHRSDEQPWFLAVNFVNPHDIMFYSSGVKQEQSRLRRNFLGPISPGPSTGLYEKHWDLPLPKSFYAEDLSRKPWAQRADVELCNNVYGRLDPKDEQAWQGLQSYYLNCVRDVDQSIEQVLLALESSGLADDTIVILTADHGEMAGAHQLRQKGPHMYKENTRVNFIVRHPDIQQGFTSEALGSTVDIVPTVLELAGLDMAGQAERYPQLAGVSLAESIGGASKRSARDERGHLYDYGVVMYLDPEFTEAVMRDHDQVTPWAIIQESLAQMQLGPSMKNRALFRGIHDGRYKFARYFAAEDHHIPASFDDLLARNDLELYDTQSDPDELHNLAADPQAQRALIERLSGRLNELLAQEVGVDDGREHPGPTFLYS